MTFDPEKITVGVGGSPLYRRIKMRTVLLQTDELISFCQTIRQSPRSDSPETHRKKHTHTHSLLAASNTLVGSVKIIVWIKLSEEGNRRPGCFL